MANRYWIGGSGDWTDTANWSTTSGGGGGASVPTASDDVYIDANSGSGTVYIGLGTTERQVSGIYASRTSTTEFSVSSSSLVDGIKLVTNGDIVYATSNTSLFFRTNGGYLRIRGNVNLDFKAPISSVSTGSRGFSCDIQGTASIISNFSFNNATVTGTVNIQQDCDIYGLSVSGGTLNTNDFNIRFGQPGMTIFSGGTINAGTSTITLGEIYSNLTGLPSTAFLDGTLNAANATFVIYTGTETVGSTPVTYNFSGKTVGAFVIKRTAGVRDSVRFNPGSNNYIRVEDNATVLFTAAFGVRRFVATNATLRSSSTGTQRAITALGSNQIFAFSGVTIQDLSITGLGTYYAGDSSIDNGNNSGFTFSNAPSIFSVKDDFPGSGLNARWSQSTSSGGSVSVTGGELVLAGTNSSSVATVRLQSQYVFDGSKISTKFFYQPLSGSPQAELVFTDGIFQYGISQQYEIPKFSIFFSGSTASAILDTGVEFDQQDVTLDSTKIYWQVEAGNNEIVLSTSEDGILYVEEYTFDTTMVGLTTTQLMTRPAFIVRGNATVTIDDFNQDLTPTTNFSGTPVVLDRGSSVQFTDLSNFSPNTWSWNFGDSTTSTQQNPLKTYSLPGIYTVALTASNGVNSDSETKNDYITVNSVTASRSAGGTLSLSGGVAANKTAIRSAGGTLLLSGDVFAIRGLNASAIERKTYMWKVYDEDNNYVGVLDDVITEPTWTEEINSDGSSMEIELARNSDSLVVGTEPLQDSDDLDILDSNNFQILTTTQSRNKVGPGSNIAHNYRVDLFVFYGEVSPILDSDSAPILDNNGETIDGTVGAPNGVRRFTGFISQINIRYGDTETTLVQLTSYGYDLDQYLVKSGSNTTVAFNSFDPSDIIKDGLDAFTTQAGGDSFTTYSDQTVATTGTVVSYTFRANTYSELLQKSLELAPPNWYYYVDLGSNLVYFQEKASTARHQFILGRHINKLDLRSYIASVVNEVLFTGGGDPALYKLYTRSVQAGTRRSLARLSDNRVTVEDSADIIANTELDNKENVQYRSTVTILDRVYDIESIRLGDTVSFRNFDSFVDSIILQVVGKRYTPDFVELQLDTIPLDINKRIEDITRNLNTQETITVPNAPTT